MNLHPRLREVVKEQKFPMVFVVNQRRAPVWVPVTGFGLRSAGSTRIAGE